MRGRSPVSSHYISTKSRWGLIHGLRNARSHDRDGENMNISGRVACLLSYRLFTNSSAPLMGDTAPGHWPVGEGSP